MDLRHETIHASMTFPLDPKELFRTLTEDTERWCSPTSVLPAQVGAATRLAVRPAPNQLHGQEIAIGHVTSVEPGKSISFTHGKIGSWDFPPDSSEITITLEPIPSGTVMRVTHLLHEHPTHRADVLPDGNPRPADYNFDDLVLRLKFFWELIFGWLAGDIRARHIDALNGLARDFVAIFTQVPREQLGAHLERIASPNVVVWDQNAGVVQDRQALTDHIARMRDYTPPGIQMTIRGEPHVGFRQCAVFADIALADGTQTATADIILSYGPGPRIEEAEVIWIEKEGH